MGDGRAQGRHAGLTRERVLRAAVRLADEGGPAALSMRKLARELNVEAMTLYHHVRNKQALEDALVEHVLTESFRMPDPEAAPPWDQLLTEYALSLHRGLTAHPGAVPLFASRPALTERTMTEMEKLLRVLNDAGFAPRTALHLAYAVAGVVIGQHLTRSEAPAPPVDLPPGELPLLAEALGEGPATLDARLEFSLDALIAGARVRLDGAGE